MAHSSRVTVLRVRWKLKRETAANRTALIMTCLHIGKRREKAWNEKTQKFKQPTVAELVDAPYTNECTELKRSQLIGDLR